MIWTLRLVFLLFLAAIVGTTAWASSVVALWNTPRAVATHPWFVATLVDTYLAFLTFWLWVAYKESNWAARLGWLLAICLLGNITMAIYMLIQLFRLPPDAPLERLLLRTR
ncbi:MAG: DUF1475 family protein [Verrucomicrobiales bacterium]